MGRIGWWRPARPRQAEWAAMDTPPELATLASPTSRASAFEREHPEAGALVRLLLRPGERIKLITTGWRSWFVDDVFLGFPTILANRTLIVGTDDRLLLIHTSARGLRPEGYVTEVPRSCVMGSLQRPLMSIFTTTGTVRFLGVPLAGRRSLDFGFEAAEQAVGAPRALCPACFEGQAVGSPRCTVCGTRFNTPWGAAWRSLIFPGWGDAWLDSLTVGAITLTVTMFLWLNVVAFVQAAGAAGPGQVELARRMVVGFLGSAAFAHGAAAVVSGLRARHGIRAASGQLPAPRPRRTGDGPAV